MKIYKIESVLKWFKFRLVLGRPIQAMHFEEFKRLAYEFASTNLSQNILKKQTDISKLIFLPLYCSQHLTNFFVSRPFFYNHINHNHNN